MSRPPLAQPTAVPRLGPHLGHPAGLRRAAERAVEIGATAVQVFADNPMAWARRAGPPEHLDAFRERLAGGGVGVASIHAAYLVNLAGDDADNRERSIGVLAADLAAAAAFGAPLVNVHVGSHRGTGAAAGIERVAAGIAEAFDRAGTPAPDDGGPIVVLENGSGAGWTLGSTVEELAAVATVAARLGVSEAALGFCLDTAHAWGAGYAIDRPAGVEALLDAFERELGLGRLRLVHLNDSKSELGSRHDRHEHVGAGMIGGEGLGHLLRSPRIAHAPFVMETPGMDQGYDAINLARARALIAGETLALLPPDAFDLPPRSKG